ncbi:haloacid dehalogenase-like hydrolase [Pirellulales bacterium]|nr:haloacid dehalogenase-like hydrolase [Pirellulales bacterium]
MIAILFDIDGTLLLTDGAGQLAFARTFAEDFGIAEISRDVAFSGRTDRAISLDLMVAHDVEPSEENWRRFRGGYLARLPEALAERQGRVLAGVTPLLESLGQHPGVALGLLTGNLERGAHLKLSHYGLAEWFPFGGFGDHAVVRDDVAAAARQAATDHLQERGQPLRAALVIGDTLHDITCARSIGAQVAAVATGGASRDALSAGEPDLLLDDLSHAQPLLDAIAALAADG